MLHTTTRMEGLFMTGVNAVAHLQKLDDAQLLERTAGQDLRAFEVLMRRHNQQTPLRGPARQPLPAHADRLAGYANQDGYPRGWLAVRARPPGVEQVAITPVRRGLSQGALRGSALDALPGTAIP